MVYSDFQIYDSTASHRNVRRIHLGILSPDEIRRMSVTNPPIEHSELYEEGKPKKQGLADPRQGPPDRNSTCVTCSGSYIDCPGHFGHIELVKPVYNIVFLPKILKILRCVCFHCSKLLLESNDPKIISIIKKTKDQSGRRLDCIVNACKNQKFCKVANSQNDVGNNNSDGCGRVQPIYRQSGLGLTIKWRKTIDENVKSKSKSKLSAAHVLQIFRAICDSTCRILGMDPHQSRPDWMILTVLTVPPLSIRPSMLKFDIAYREDDLTYNLANIIKANRTLKESEQNGATSHTIAKQVEELQHCCAALIDNNISNIPPMCRKNGRPLECLRVRLTGKDGQIRKNFTGKRVDFSARSVITPDPNLAIDQIGIPRSIAQKLTIPELVSPHNIKWLQELVQNHAAKKIILANGQCIDLRFHPRPSDINLQLGSVIERNMLDDDLVVVNRQPTLHKMSMMAHRVKILPWSTFRLNLSVTTPYNAGFDGDEMNLHVPQSIEVKAELSQLMMVPRLLITPQSNRPVMGIVQDSLTAATKITRRDVFLDKSQFMNLVMQLPSWNGIIPQPAILKPKPLWTGKQLFSLVLPKQVNCIRLNATHLDTEDSGPFKWISPGDTKVILHNGQLLAGILCKRTLGTSSGSLGHIIFMECGHEVAGNFYSYVQLVVNNWLLIEGHSIGIWDVITDQKTYVNVQQTIRESKRKVQDVIIRSLRGELQKERGNSLRQTFESTVNKHLNDARMRTGSVVLNSLSDFNQLKLMVVSGAKGSSINISQIIACLGQQSVEGKRIPFGFKHRTLPHFIKDDYGPEARGFVENSYLQGLTPVEFFFHAMAGREALIDTAVKTTETGYIQRRLVKIMESVMVKYDGTIRNQSEQLIQFIYGEDGLAAENLEFQSIISLKASNVAFENSCNFNVIKDKECLRQYLNDNAIRDLFNNENSSKILHDEWHQLCQDRDRVREIFSNVNESRIVLPCNVDRLILNARKIFNISKKTRSDLSPIEVIQGLENLIKHLVIVKGNDRLSEEAQHNATMLMSILIRSSLCSRQVLQVHHLTSEAFAWLCKEIETRFQQAQVHPGEMVGVLAAQSIGEPATQMTLNAFHYAGISAKNITLGIPRLNEIINLSKTPKTPSMTIFLNDQIVHSENQSKQVLSSIEHCTLRKLTYNTSIYYDPDPQNTIIKEDEEWVKVYYELHDENVSKVSPWLLRIELDSKRIIDKGITMEQIYQKITEVFGDDLSVIFTDNNAEKLVIRVRIMNDLKSKLEENETLEDHNMSKMSDDDFLRCVEDVLVSQLTLKGIKSISKVYMINSAANNQYIGKGRFAVNAHGTIEQVFENFLVTDGSSLRKVLSMKDVDHHRTYTNDIIETFEVLGIEGARKTIEYEINNVISFDGSYVNNRHLALLCDIMTTRGHLMPITRQGVNRGDFSPLMKSYFELNVDALIEAAAHSQNDPLTGVSEKISLGQLAKIGTGCFDIILDNSKCALPVHSPMVDLDKYSGIMSKDGMKKYKENSSVTTSWTGSMSTFPKCDPYDISKHPHHAMLSEYVFQTTTLCSSTAFYSSTSPQYNPNSPIYSSSQLLSSSSRTSPVGKMDASSPHDRSSTARSKSCSPKGYLNDDDDDDLMD